MEQLQYEVNFLTIKYQEQTIKLHQIGIEDIFTNFYANSFSSIFTENRDGILDEKKGYILSNIEITNNYMLGEYGVFPDISNEQVRNISYSDYTDEDKIQASTHITYFLINFNNLNVYLIKNSNTPSFASAMNQVLRRYGFRIDFEVDKDWKKNIIESLYEISSIEVSVYNDTLTENNMVSLHKLNDIKDTLIYEGCKFKIKNITPPMFYWKVREIRLY